MTLVDKILIKKYNFNFLLLNYELFFSRAKSSCEVQRWFGIILLFIWTSLDVLKTFSEKAAFFAPVFCH